MKKRRSGFAQNKFRQEESEEEIEKAMKRFVFEPFKISIPTYSF